MRLGLARPQGDALCRAVEAAGWEPVSRFLTQMEPTLAPPPLEAPDAVLLLSPAAARHALLPPGVPCLAQGEGTRRALMDATNAMNATNPTNATNAMNATNPPDPSAPPGGRQVLVSATPRAEGLFELLKATFPQGGAFLLARAERSREHLEEAAAGTPWRLLPWITHRERPLEPPPALEDLDAFLALSPLQAELLGPRFQGLRLAWGQRTQLAFGQVGYPCHGCCEPDAAALTLLLLAQSNS